VQAQLHASTGVWEVQYQDRDSNSAQRDLRCRQAQWQCGQPYMYLHICSARVDTVQAKMPPLSVSSYSWRV
jgi:hypothetical protein